MTESVAINKEAKLDEQYISLHNQILSLLNPDDNLVSNLSNFCAAIKQSIDKISWVGFYFSDGEKLLLGPFQGKVACTNIKIGIGVCGKAAELRETIIVPDVNKFSGHIFCDTDSKSEIVVPIIKEEKLIGVLDVDSSKFNSFDETDKIYLEKFCSYLSKNIFNNKNILF